MPFLVLLYVDHTTFSHLKLEIQLHNFVLSLLSALKNHGHSDICLIQ